MTPFKGEPSTLAELLELRHQQSSHSRIHFLDNDGAVTKSLSSTDLYCNARQDALRLLSLGLRPREDIVVTSFSDHETHIRFFWACCFGECHCIFKEIRF